MNIIDKAKQSVIDKFKETGEAPYGLCPICKDPGYCREKRPNGNDECINDHNYPSADSIEVFPNIPSFIENPDKYIKAHIQLAKKAREELEFKGYEIIREKTVRDGCMDGMYVIQLIVETPRGVLIKLKWNDGDKKWFESMQGSGGFFPFDIEDYI